MNEEIERKIREILAQIPDICPKCNNELNWTINRDGPKVTYWVGCSCRWSDFKTTRLKERPE